MSEANVIRASWGGYIKDLVTATHPKENYAIALVGIWISGSTRRIGLDSGEGIVKTIGAESVKIHKDLISETINLSCKMQSVAGINQILNPAIIPPSILRIILNYWVF